MTWAYIAGFFDGEGSITHNGKGYRVTIAQTNLSVLRRIREHAGFGGIITVTKRKRHWRDAWVYYVAKQNEVQYFLRACYPYLVVKRQKTQQVLGELPKIVARQQARVKISIEHKRQVMALRRRNLTWREIGKCLNIDWGYARRLYLRIQNRKK